MSHRALDWLRQMNSAVSVRLLYPADHPRAVAVVRGLEEATARLTADHPEILLFVIEGRLACNSELVPGSDGMTARTFETLRSKGCDRLTIRRGVTSAELRLLVNTLVGRTGTPEGTLQPTAHVRFSVLDTEERDIVRSEAPVPSLGVPIELPELWREIDEARSLNTDALERILAPLLSVVSSDTSGMLPLASLRTHDEYTATHVTNVAVLTMALAQASGLPEAAVRMIGVGALLHDIGKMKVPADILSAPGRLTAEQHGLVRRHPEMGARMLLETPGVPQLAVIVAYEHHLQADGGGYPSVPSGWRINPASEMTHVADVYDALRTHRPYRSGLDHHTVIETMLRDRGTVFADELLDLFLTRVVPRTHAPDAGPAPQHPKGSAPDRGRPTV
jgi:putative nucleotidyltransferase with HDIG domain